MLEPRRSMSPPYTWVEIAISPPAAGTAWVSPAGGGRRPRWAPGCGLDEVVAVLALDTAVDADDAPRDVVVDRGRLAGAPHERDDRQPSARRDVQQVLAVGVVPGGAVGGREPAVGGDQPAQVVGDGVRRVDARVGGAHEGREGRVAGEGGGGRQGHAATVPRCGPRRAGEPRVVR